MATSWYFLHWSQQAERLARQHPYRYRRPLHVPAGPEFSHDDLNETYCMEFFSVRFQIFIPKHNSDSNQLYTFGNPSNDTVLLRYSSSVLEARVDYTQERHPQPASDPQMLGLQPQHLGLGIVWDR